jgi:DinB superfamily
MTTAKIADDLEATVQDAAERLRSLDAATVSHRPAPDRWTIKEVIGHLIDSATNNHQRFVRAQFVQELVFPAYQQNEWAQCQFCNDLDWGDLVELWRRYNLHLAHVIRSAASTSLGTPCTIGDYPPMTLEALMADDVVHIKHHLTKIAQRVETDSHIAG